MNKYNLLCEELDILQEITSWKMAAAKGVLSPKNKELLGQMLKSQGKNAERYAAGLRSALINKLLKIRNASKKLGLKVKIIRIHNPLESLAIIGDKQITLRVPETTSALNKVDAGRLIVKNHELDEVLSMLYKKSTNSNALKSPIVTIGKSGATHQSPNVLKKELISSIGPQLTGSRSDILSTLLSVRSDTGEYKFIHDSVFKRYKQQQRQVRAIMKNNPQFARYIAKRANDGYIKNLLAVVERYKQGDSKALHQLATLQNNILNAFSKYKIDPKSLNFQF